MIVDKKGITEAIASAHVHAAASYLQPTFLISGQCINKVNKWSFSITADHIQPMA